MHSLSQLALMFRSPSWPCYYGLACSIGVFETKDQSSRLFLRRALFEGKRDRPVWLRPARICGRAQHIALRAAASRVCPRWGEARQARVEKTDCIESGGTPNQPQPIVWPNCGQTEA